MRADSTPAIEAKIAADTAFGALQETYGIAWMQADINLPNNDRLIVWRFSDSAARYVTIASDEGVVYGAQLV
jgi:hypothetical protein